MFRNIVLTENRELKKYLAFLSRIILFKYKSIKKKKREMQNISFH